MLPLARSSRPSLAILEGSCCSISVQIMMEIDRMSYIFGSFARRRQSQEVGAAKRRSIEPTQISHDRSKSTPHTSKKPTPTSPRAKSICNFVLEDSKFKCPMCRRLFVEPKVLPCLHTFCLRCLQELEANDYSNWCDDESDGKNWFALVGLRFGTVLASPCT